MPDQPCPSMLIVGAGAVGALYGGMWSRAGAAVSVVSRSDYDVVCENGFDIRSVWGDFDFHPVGVHPSVAEAGDGYDFVVVATKSLPDLDVADLIAPAVGPSTSIVMIQNGAEIEGPVHAAFPANELISGLAFVCSRRDGPGRICHEDYGRLTLGVYPEGIGENVPRLLALLESVGVETITEPDIITARWRKLLWNASFNTISVLGGGKDTARLLADVESARLARRVMAEVCAIATAAGHPLGGEDIRRHLDDTQRMKPYRPSMLLDFEAGRPMEIEAILGAALQAASREQIDAPRLRVLYALLRLIAQRD